MILVGCVVLTSWIDSPTHTHTHKQVAAGEIKGFTGVDAPYEPPLTPEIVLPNYKMTITECVDVFMQKLRSEGVLEGGKVYPNGLPPPDGGEVVDLHVPQSQVGTWMEASR